MHDKKNRVVITGIGLINSLGNDTKTVWNKIISGKSGISNLPKDFWPEKYKDYPYTFAGLVKNDQEILDTVFPAAKQRKTDRFIHLAMVAGNEAMLDSGLSKTFPKNRQSIGAMLGIGIGGIKTIEKSISDLNRAGPKRVSPFLIPRAISNQAAGWLCMEWDLQGSMSAVVNACSSSADAIGYAFRSIRDGYADYMLTGGTESCITPLSMAAFGNMRALCSNKNFDDSTKASRPFDKNRAGFVMGEGAGILVLERMDLALKRGANIYAEIKGFGISADAYHITAMHPDARGAVSAVKMALKDAKIDKSEINYVNAHGTSTQMNDKIETFALKKVFGSNIDPQNNNHIAVSSTKSMIGHLLGAAGGTEASLSVLALKHQILPPTINYNNPDPDCDLDYVPNEARKSKINTVMSNSFGFGGGNSVLVFKRID
ncbi:beta-ketoacyl-ACP synthase II [Candidatus Dependentiae bacterium]|nr:beta-ketoacyl-ACP synthase II [Candidatus Dependentiae bacterium]